MTAPLIVYTIQAAGYSAASTKVYMRRVGSATRNEDGSLDVTLEAPTACTRLHIREFVPAPPAKETP